MRKDVYQTAQLGDLVVGAFDKAAQHSSDSREVSRLAPQAATAFASLRTAGNALFPVSRQTKAYPQSILPSGVE